MTVSSQTNKVIYIGNGVAKEFAIPFSFLEREHIKVRQKKNDIQTERTDWTVKSGNLIFADAPESGAEIAIVREVPLTQETDYRDNEILHAETLERNFDKLTMQVQQLAEKSARAVTVDIFDDTQAAELIPSIRKAVSNCKNYAQQMMDKSMVAHQSFPSACRIDFIFNSIVTETAQTYVCPADGWISVYCSSVDRALLTNSTMGHVSLSLGCAAGSMQVCIIPVSKNDFVTMAADAGHQAILGHSAFHYANGAI